MTKRIVLLNGPPRCGKDTAAAGIVAATPGWARIGFSDHLKEATHAAYGMPELPVFAFEDRKDVPLPEFFGLTPRRAYIAHSEKYMKVLHGKRVFGKLFNRRARASEAHTIIVPDSGFLDEALVQVDDFGPENVLLIRLHRKGCSYVGDSRSYIDLADVGVQCFDIDNDGTPGELCGKVTHCIARWARA